MHVEQDFQHVGRPVKVAHRQGPLRVTQPEGDSGFQVLRAADALLADVAGDVDDVGDHALRHKAAAVANHADGLAVAGKQSMGGVAHVGAGGRVGGQHAAFGLCIVDQHVDAHGARRVQALNHGHRGDVKAQRRYQRQGVHRRRGAGLDGCAQGF